MQFIAIDRAENRFNANGTTAEVNVCKIVAPRWTIAPSFSLFPMHRTRARVLDGHKTRISDENKRADSATEGERREGGGEREKNPLKYYWNWMEWTFGKEMLLTIDNRERHAAHAYQLPRCGRAHLQQFRQRRSHRTHAQKTIYWKWSNDSSLFWSSRDR